MNLSSSSSLEPSEEEDEEEKEEEDETAPGRGSRSQCGLESTWRLSKGDGGRGREPGMLGTG